MKESKTVKPSITCVTDVKSYENLSGGGAYIYNCNPNLDPCQPEEDCNPDKCNPDWEPGPGC